MNLNEEILERFFFLNFSNGDEEMEFSKIEYSYGNMGPVKRFIWFLQNMVQGNQIHQKFQDIYASQEGSVKTYILYIFEGVKLENCKGKIS